MAKTEPEVLNEFILERNQEMKETRKVALECAVRFAQVRPFPVPSNDILEYAEKFAAFIEGRKEQ